MDNKKIFQAYEMAKEKYAELGVDVDTSLKSLKHMSLSIHCWQGDDVGGFEKPDSELSGGGIQVTGNYPGKARNIDELRMDLKKVYSLIPGKHRLNLHAIYGDFGGKYFKRDQIAPEHFKGWIEWTKENDLKIDFNSTCFSHPMADSGFTLSSKNKSIRDFWIKHVKKAREISAFIGKKQSDPCIHNLWIPDGSKDIPIDRFGYRKLLKESLDEIFKIDYSKSEMKDAFESKLFGIGSEAFVVGSHEFYLGYALIHGKMICLDLGHFHPTELVADKISSILQFSDEIMITQPETALQVDFEKINIICFGDNNGRLEIFATGGTGIIKYAISPQLNQFFETNVFENLEPGNYDVIVQDELGCFEVFDFEITEPEQVLINIVSDTIIPEICDGDINGSFSIEIQGGTPPYSLNLDDYNGDYITGEIDQTFFDFENLGGGNHIVYVRDSVGCESEWIITFPESVFINPMLVVENECFDNEISNRIVVTVNENVNPSDLDYSLNNGLFQTSNEFIDLPPSINNFIIVRHINGCEVMTDFFDIETFDPISITLTNQELNEIQATVSGGSGEYQFTLNEVDYGSTNIFPIGESGTYEVIVTDSNGCNAVLEYLGNQLCHNNLFMRWLLTIRAQ